MPVVVDVPVLVAPAGELVVVVLVLPPAGDGFTIVVLLSVLVAGDAVVVVVGWTSVLCSQLARSAALARMQSIFFIGVFGWCGLCSG